MKTLLILVLIFSLCFFAYAEEVSDPFNTRVEVTTKDFQVEDINHVWVKVKMDRTVTVEMNIEQIGYYIGAAEQDIEKGKEMIERGNRALAHWQDVLKDAKKQAAKVKLGKVH